MYLDNKNKARKNNVR